MSIVGHHPTLRGAEMRGRWVQERIKVLKTEGLNPGACMRRTKEDSVLGTVWVPKSTKRERKQKYRVKSQKENNHPTIHLSLPFLPHLVPYILHSPAQEVM